MVSSGKHLMQTVIFQHMHNTEQLDSLLGKCPIIIFRNEAVLFFEIFKAPFHIVFGISVFFRKKALDLIPFTFIKADSRRRIVVFLQQLF